MSPPLRWRWFFAWAGVGVVGIVGVFAVFALPVMLTALAIAAVCARLLLNREEARPGFIGAWCGAALPVLYLAYLNRDGPGQVCSGQVGIGRGDISCTEEWSPWPFLAVALIALVGGTAVFWVQRRRRAAAAGEERRGGVASP